VLQIDPGQQGCRTVFLHVVTATEASQADPPRASYRRIGPGRIEVRVAGAATILAVPDWFEG